MRLFFYGTLRDGEVRAAVLGRAAGRITMVEAVAPGWRAVYWPGRSYPFLVPARGFAAPGVMAGWITAALVARLKSYEGPEYRIAPVTVLAGGARRRVAAFLPRIPVSRSAAAFELGAWQEMEKPRFLAGLARGAQRSA